MIFIPEDEKKDKKDDKKEEKKGKICPHCGKDISKPPEKKDSIDEHIKETDPRIDTIIEFLKSEVSKKTDSDTSKWNLDELFGAYRVLGSIKKETLLSDPPKIKKKTDSEGNEIVIPEWAKRVEGKAIGEGEA